MPTGRSEWNGPKLVGKFPGLASKLKKKKRKKKEVLDSLVSCNKIVRNSLASFPLWISLRPMLSLMVLGAALSSSADMEGMTAGAGNS